MIFDWLFGRKKPPASFTPAPEQPIVVTPNDLDAAIARCGLRAHAATLAAMARRSILISHDPIDSASLTPDDSYLGGDFAFLPSDMPWPVRGDYAMAHLATLRLAYIAAHDQSRLLPPSGTLSLFYDTDETPWGGDVKDRDGFRVFYFDDRSPPRILTPRPKPYNAYGKSDESIPAVRCRFTTTISLPDEFTDGLSPEQHALKENPRYQSLLESLGIHRGTNGIHRLLGWPSTIQHSPEEQCAALADSAFNLKTDNLTDWLLLLQLDTDDALNWMWGDCGRLYLCIHKHDLAAARFDRCWLVLQCY